MSDHRGREGPADRERANERLRPYVPRLVIDWLRDDPTALSREVQGTLAFVDISGFTALSERLARRGKIGAELMRDTLDGVFTALLDVAYDDGAGLLKWGGDAVLLLFDGPDHAARACHACWGMRRTLERVGRLKDGSARITLRMSIGIHTGTFLFYLAGSVHRELLVAGPDVTTTVTMEALADPGEIAVSPPLASLLDPAFVAPRPDGLILLVEPPPVVTNRAPDVGDVRGLDLPLCLPLAVRAHLMLERTEPEHRTITAAFIDLVDTDAQLERLGTAGLGRALDERFRTIQEVALRYEVPFYESDIGKSSVKALLTAGAPTTTGHDEERMLRALREIVETPGEVAMRIGVNTGRVFTGDFGPPYRRSYRVFGDAINTAARVMSRAETGQILATEAVIDRSRSAFQTTAIEPFAAKGKTAPVRASIVGPLVGRRALELRETAFAGREREIETLLGVIEDARRSRGWIVELAGGAGLGKSRLVADAIARAGDVFVFQTRCEEYESSTPYFPLRAPFRSLLGLQLDDEADVVAARLARAAATVDPELLPWIPLLGLVLGVDLPPSPETGALDERFIPARLADVLGRFLYTSLAGTTTMLVVEDVEHMDESSRDLLRRLAQLGAERKQVLLLTSDGTGGIIESGGGDDLNALSFSLHRLPTATAVAMVDAATRDDPLPRHVVEQIARRSGGNPMFLFELIDVVRETGSSDALPETVEAIIAADIDRLEPADRTVLRYASVMGTNFDPDVLAIALDGEVELGPDVWLRFEEQIEPNPSGGLRFRATLIRDVAYEGLPFRRRRLLHGRVAEAIEAREGDDAVAALALHYSEAQRHDRAWRYCRLAGDRARRIYANTEAVMFYRRAAASARRCRDTLWDEEVGVWRSLGDALLALGEFEEASAAYAQARHRFRGDRVSGSELLLQQATVHLLSRNFPQMIRWVNRGLGDLVGEVGPEASSARARLLASGARARLHQGRGRAAAAYCAQAIEEASRAGDLAREALAGAYYALDQARLLLAVPGEPAHLDAAITIYRDLGRHLDVGRVLTGSSNRAYLEGRWDDQLELLREARDAYEQCGDMWYSALAIFNIAERLAEQRRPAEAEELARACHRIWKAAKYRSDAGEAASLLGLILSSLGRFEEAHTAFDEATAIFRAEGDEFELLKVEVRSVACYVEEGRHVEALERSRGLAVALAVMEDTSTLRSALHRSCGRALAALGRDEEARQSFEESLRAADEDAGGFGVMSARYERALTLEALAALDPDRASSGNAEQAAAILEPLGVVGLSSLAASSS